MSLTDRVGPKEEEKRLLRLTLFTSTIGILETNTLFDFLFKIQLDTWSKLYSIHLNVYQVSQLHFSELQYISKLLRHPVCILGWVKIFRLSCRLDIRCTIDHWSMFAKIIFDPSNIWGSVAICIIAASLHGQPSPANSAHFKTLNAYIALDNH